jgi:hypothetical protein
VLLGLGIYAGEEVGKGLHAIGCKLHLHHSHCVAPPLAPPQSQP